MKDLLKDLLCSSGAGDRPLLRTVLYFLPVALIALIASRALYAGTAPVTGISHAQRSFDAAVSATYCGKPDWFSGRYSVHSFLLGHPDLMKTPVRNVIAAQADSVENYCHYVNDPIQIEENSLHWLERLALWSDPHMTPDRLVQFLGACRMAIILIFGFALLRSGASILFTLAAMVIAGDVVGGARDTAYTFAIALPLLHVGIYGLAMSARAIRARGPALWGFALAMGALVAFSASMRTNQLPLDVAMFGIFLILLYAGGDRPVAVAKSAGAALAAFGVGYALYAAVFIAPLRVKGLENYTFHPISHALVLGLGMPENTLSRREGIRWDDEIGLIKARTVRPDVAYLGPNYDAALRDYYFGLWRRYPGEMRSVYWLKLRATGSGVFMAAANVGNRYHVPRAIGEWLDRTTNGVVLFGAAALTFLLGMVRYRRTRSNRLLIVAFIGLTALAILSESVLTYSLYVSLYFGGLLYFVFFAALLLLQAAIDAAAARS